MDMATIPSKQTSGLIDLDSDASFAALSYVWGFSKESRSISCGSVIIEVTENCYAALLALRRTRGAFTIWVDAICINQQDVREKEHQIPLMGAIYGMAKTVYVWLGEGDDSTNRAMDYLNRTGLRKYYEDHLVSPWPIFPAFWGFWSLYTSFWCPINQLH
jgi:hypothetical protein